MSASQDVVFALSAAHEIRDAQQRAAFFQEARRVLKGKGRVVVVEQLRNFVNFSCFGVAAFHFLSRRTWLKSFTSAGLAVRDEFAITPFVRVFVLQPRQESVDGSLRGPQRPACSQALCSQFGIDRKRVS
jgi:ubiquinone/menaquinone biosynthesis C-methylase UbiE